MWKKIVIIIGLLVAVQLPYIWFIFHSEQNEQKATYLKPNLEKRAEINWFNPEDFRLRWYIFDNLSEPTVLKSGDNLTLWIRDCRVSANIETFNEI